MSWIESRRDTLLWTAVVWILMISLYQTAQQNGITDVTDIDVVIFGTMATVLFTFICAEQILLKIEEETNDGS